MKSMLSAMDRLTAVFAAPPWDAEVGRARQEYDQSRGGVREDDELFETHLSSFLEWYLLERSLQGEGSGEPPVFVALRGEGLTADERQSLRALALSYRSAFEVVDVLRRELLLADLVRGGLWRVQQDPPLEGIDPGDIFEARLVPWEGRVYFGPVFCFHPRSAREVIRALLRQAEAEGRLGPQMVFALAEMRLKHDRFRNIAVERIYSTGWRSPED